MTQSRIDRPVARATVYLKKSDGTIIKVPLSKLCEDDRKFVSQQRAAPAPPVTVIKIRPGQIVAPPDALVKSAEGAVGQRDEAQLKSLTEKLGLDADQQAKIKVIYAKSAQKMKELLGKGQWNPAMGSNPSYVKGPKNPVETVNWDDCQKFLGKLNAKSAAGAGKNTCKRTMEIPQELGRSCRLHGRMPGREAWS